MGFGAFQQGRTLAALANLAGALGVVWQHVQGKKSQRYACDT